MPDAPSCSVRTATPADAASVLAIYEPYVRTTAIVFAYEPPTLAEQRASIERISARYPFLVLERAGVVIGYACAHPFKGFPAYDWNVETTIYLDAAARGHGYGKILHQALEDCLRAQGVLAMDACIAVTEQPDAHLTNASRSFHEKLGYRLCAEFTRCGYKFDTWYDMIWMEKILGEHRIPPRPFICAPQAHLDDVLARFNSVQLSCPQRHL